MLLIYNNYKNIKNKYNIFKKYTAGLILKPIEVNYIKIKKNLSLRNSYIILKNKELYVKNMIIHNINRNIKILLNKTEIKEIIYKIKKKYIILILNIFSKKYIKLTIILSLIKINKNEK